MAPLGPKKLLLRCYGYKSGNASYIGVCLDLNLAVQAESPGELRKKMNGVIISYLEAVLDTQDRSSIPPLLERRAPLRDWIIYYLLRAWVKIRQIPTRFTFKAHIPFHLANHC